MSGLSLGDSPHVPLPLPVEDNVRLVIDTLAIPDLAKETAVGRVVDLQAVAGDVPCLVLVVEASVLGKCSTFNLLLRDVGLVSLGGPVVARPPRLPVIASRDIPPPALQADAAVSGSRPRV